LLQGLRPGAARSRRDRSRRARDPEHQGLAHGLTRIAVIDYGMGNLRSVAKALERAGAQVEVEARPGPADGLVLPGVGAFPKAMERVRELGLDRLIGERVAAGVPVLGICLGMQLLFE